jgi:hypothetical protein
MTILNNRVAALAFGLAVAAVASPSLAQRNHDQNPDHVSAARAQAIRDCTALENKYTEYTYGQYEISIYRACMAQHGQPE